MFPVHVGSCCCPLYCGYGGICCICISVISQAGKYIGCCPNPCGHCCTIIGIIGSIMYCICSGCGSCIGTGSCPGVRITLMQDCRLRVRGLTRMRKRVPPRWSMAPLLNSNGPTGYTSLVSSMPFVDMGWVSYTMRGRLQVIPCGITVVPRTRKPPMEGMAHKRTAAFFRRCAAALAPYVAVSLHPHPAAVLHVLRQVLRTPCAAASP